MKTVNLSKLPLAWKMSSIAFIYAISAILSARKNYLASGILIISAISLYFLFSLLDEKNYLKLDAVFSGVWLGTIGLNQLRIMEYQVVWQAKTWVLLGLSHLVFLVGIEVSRYSFPFLWNTKKLTKIKKYFSYSENHADALFTVTIITQCIGIVLFIINLLLKGYIPMLETRTNQQAYHSFYSRLVVFYVASTVSGGISYFLIKKGSGISRGKKIWLGFSSFFIIFIIQIVTVKRGQFLLAALIVVVFVYLFSNKKLIVVFLSLLIMFGVYQLGSVLRGYTNEQLKTIFPVKDEIVTEPNDVENQIVFLYTYFTVSHDNFNSAVVNSEIRTNGLFQIAPFSVILRFPQLRQSIANADNEITKYFVKPYFNTYNLIGYFYFDFGVIGILTFMFFWSFVFGIFEKIATMSENPFFLTIYGIFSIPVFFCFFAPWMSNFIIWLYCGTTMMMFLGYKFLIIRKTT